MCSRRLEGGGVNKVSCRRGDSDFTFQKGTLPPPPPLPMYDWAIDLIVVSYHGTHGVRVAVSQCTVRVNAGVDHKDARFKQI